MNARDLIAALQGQNPESTILILTADEFYDVRTIATPVADATVLVVSAEVSEHPSVAAVQAMPDTVASMQGRSSDAPAEAPTDVMGEAPKDTTTGGATSSDKPA